jgi:hypothetical protein
MELTALVVVVDAATPLFQTSLEPDLIHVYFKPPETAVLFNLEHALPAMELTALVVVVDAATPLFQTSLEPDLIHVYFKPPELIVDPTFKHDLPE